MRRPTRFLPLLGVALVGAVLPANGAHAQQLDSTLVSAFRWRSIGPANMGGRITDIEGLPRPSKTFYVVAAAGGIWKTTNAGTTFRPIFDHERTVSMGDLAIAPCDSNILYLGTGEEDSRNSISPGGGIYKSTDGGKTWKFIGLDETQQIGRIVVDPRDPNIVYVAALGHAWGPNPERGLYKTHRRRQDLDARQVRQRQGRLRGPRDRSEQPERALGVELGAGSRTVLPPERRPGLRALEEHRRRRDVDRGQGRRFPRDDEGPHRLRRSRRANPKIIYALVEADTMMNGSQDKPAKAQVRPSGLYRSEDGGATWKKRNDADVASLLLLARCGSIRRIRTASTSAPRR